MLWVRSGQPRLCRSDRTAPSPLSASPFGPDRVRRRAGSPAAGHDVDRHDQQFTSGGAGPGRGRGRSRYRRAGGPGGVPQARAGTLQLFAGAVAPCRSGTARCRECWPARTASRTPVAPAPDTWPSCRPACCGPVRPSPPRAVPARGSGWHRLVFATCVRAYPRGERGIHGLLRTGIRATPVPVQQEQVMRGPGHGDPAVTGPGFRRDREHARAA